MSPTIRFGMETVEVPEAPDLAEWLDELKALPMPTPAKRSVRDRIEDALFRISEWLKDPVI